MMHHPPKFSMSSPNWISLDEKSTTKLKSKLANQNILAIVCGHIHINQTNFWHGIPIIISNGLYSTIDLSIKDEMRIIEGKSFNVMSYKRQWNWCYSSSCKTNSKGF